jgi:hypothetical protein
MNDTLAENFVNFIKIALLLKKTLLLNSPMQTLLILYQLRKVYNLLKGYKVTKVVIKWMLTRIFNNYTTELILKFFDLALTSQQGQILMNKPLVYEMCENKEDDIVIVNILS